MKQSKIILIVILSVAVTGGVYYYIHQNQTQNNMMQWTVTSGPFSINNSTYRLGDMVFVVVNGLKQSDVGNITVYDPQGRIFTIASFNGSMKSDFDFFFQPKPDDSVPVCTAQELVGNWTINFQGTSYRPLEFKIINSWVQGSQEELRPIPNCNSVSLTTQQVTVTSEEVASKHTSSHTITTIDLRDQASCQEAPLSGSWYSTNSTCAITNLVLNSSTPLTIDSSIFPSITLKVTGALDNNQGSITNNGTINTEGGNINNNGVFVNEIGRTINAGQQGSINTNDQGSINNNGVLVNNGIINVEVSGAINANGGGTFLNNGRINNDGSFYNDGVLNTKGTIVNLEDGTITNSGGGNITNYYEGTIGNNGTITNYGLISNNGNADNNGTIVNIVGDTITNKGMFDNNGTVSNNGAISNTGTIKEFCAGTITGYKILGEAPVISPCSLP